MQPFLVRFSAVLLFHIAANTLSLELASAAEPNEVWPPTLRQIESERQILIVVFQSSITTTHPITPPGSPGGCSSCKGGAAALLVGTVLGGLITNKLAAGKQKKDQEFLDLMVTMGDALKDYNFDSSAAAATEKMVMAAPWLGTVPVQISKEETNASFNQLLESNESPQILAIRYMYRLVNELTALEVDTDIALIDKGTPLKGKPGNRTTFENSLFLRHVNYVVPLKGAQIDALANEKIWAQDNARLVRNALDAVIAKSVTVNGKAIALTPKDAAALNASPRIKVGAGWKRIIDTDEEGELIADSTSRWTYQFAPIEPPSDAAKQ
jgi:hypothetical protein